MKRIIKTVTLTIVKAVAVNDKVSRCLKAVASSRGHTNFFINHTRHIQSLSILSFKSLDKYLLYANLYLHVI